MSANVVVFGGSGFIGTHLIRRLNATGVTITSIDILPEREKLPGVRYLRSDVRDLRDVVVDHAVDKIYNLAAVHTTPGHPTNEYYETNVLGALEVTRFATSHQAREIVFTSSISVYGTSEETKTEEATPNPSSAYGYSKLIAERVHRYWVEERSENRLVIVRPAVVFGVGEGGNFTRLAKLLAKGVFIYPGRKDTVKACIYVEDLLDAILLAEKKGEQLILFNAAYPQGFTIQQIVETLISRHFPKAKTLLLPKVAVLGAARGLQALDAFGIGMHHERVTKLTRSTNIYPGWLVNQGKQFPDALESAFDRWAAASGNQFK